MASNTVLRPSMGRLLRQGPSHSSSSRGAPSMLTAGFSTSAPRCRRKTKDNNKNRGVSTIYRSGTRQKLSVSDIPLPKPRDFKPQIAVDESHGLWKFFPSPGKLIWTPGETEEHGRGWTVEELRKKSWEDLHSLWWVCCRERNMLSTSRAELARGQFGFGEREIESRTIEVKKTMRAIRHVLTERYYTWEDALKVAESDPEVNLEAAEGEEAYTPSAYEEDYHEESWTDLEKGVSTSEAPQASDDKRTNP